MNKLIITAAINGGITTKENNPNLPITPKEIAQSVYDCWNAGASIVHIHARECDGTPSQRVEVYREIVERIREKTDILICLTTTGFNVNGDESSRLKPLTCMPEIASFTPGSFNRNGKVFINTPSFILKLAEEIDKHGIRPEFEIFDFGMIGHVVEFARKGIVKGPLNFQFVLGVNGGISASVKNLLFLIESIPKDSNWFVAAVGKGQLPMNLAGILAGGHVRTGFEDNVYYKYHELASSNAQLVERITKYSMEIGREVATPMEARQILNI